MKFIFILFVLLFGNGAIAADNYCQDTKTYMEDVRTNSYEGSIIDFVEKNNEPDVIFLGEAHGEYAAYKYHRQFQKELDAANIKLGPHGLLFSVTAEGLNGRSTYKIEGIVEIPVETPKPKPPRAKLNNGKCPQGYELAILPPGRAPPQLGLFDEP